MISADKFVEVTAGAALRPYHCSNYFPPHHSEGRDLLTADCHPRAESRPDWPEWVEIRAIYWLFTGIYFEKRSQGGGGSR